jgi:hypothetical protein
MVATRHRFYIPFAFACAIHGGLFSGLVWFGLTHMVNTPNSSMPLPGIETACEVLLFSWPIWAIVLWWSSKKWYHVLLPLFLGFAGLSPGLLILLALAGMGHNC